MWALLSLINVWPTWLVTMYLCVCVSRFFSEFNWIQPLTFRDIDYVLTYCAMQIEFLVLITVPYHYFGFLKMRYLAKDFAPSIILKGVKKVGLGLQGLIVNGISSLGWVENVLHFQ